MVREAHIMTTHRCRGARSGRRFLWAQKPASPLSRETRARGGARTGCQTLQIRHSPENFRNPAQSDTSSTRSEAQAGHSF